jgi:uncharacterized FlgJ-related protein
MNYDQRIYNQAIYDGIPPNLALLMVAQARHETGGYSSSVFKLCNNAFGYKWVGQSTADGSCSMSPEGNSYARYSSIEDSTYEISQWIYRRQLDGKFPDDLTTIKSEGQYAQLLKNTGYYGDTVSNYTKGLLYWISRINISPVAAAAGGGGLLLVAALLFLFRKKIFR